MEIGIVIHGPFCKETIKLIKNAQDTFGGRNVVYVTSNNIEDELLSVKKISPKDPGQIQFLGRKGDNLLRHVQNIKEGCEYLKKVEYIFKVRSDLNMSKSNFNKIKRYALKYPTKILRLKTFMHVTPWNINDYIFGGPHFIMERFCELVLQKIDKFMDLLIFNKYKPNQCNFLIFTPEIIISIALYFANYNLDIRDFIDTDILTNSKKASSAEGAFVFFKFNNILFLFPNRLSVISKWNLRHRFQYYLKPSFMTPMINLMDKLRFYVR